MDDVELLKLLSEHLRREPDGPEGEALRHGLIRYLDGVEERIDDLYSRVGELEDELRRLRESR